MRCIITRASETRFENKPCPCNGAVWDQNKEEWCIDLSSMQDLISLLEDNSNIFNGMCPSAIVTTDTIGNVKITFYDDYIE